MADQKFRKPVINQQLVIAPPPMVAIDVRIWAVAGGRRWQRSHKVWCPDTDDLLSLEVGREMIGATIDDHAEWAADELERLWLLYVNPEPFPD